MDNETEHNKRVLTELWYHWEKSRTANNSGAISQCQKLLIQAALDKYNLVDVRKTNKPGTRVPMFVESEWFNIPRADEK